MPRPEQKPPTEGGGTIEAINKEFVEYLEANPGSDSVYEKTGKMYTFFVKKIADLQDEIKELKNEVHKG